MSLTAVIGTKIMTTPRYRQSYVMWTALMVGSLIPAGPSRLLAQEPPISGAFQLRPGVIVQPDRRMLFLMNPNGGVDAVETEGGTIRWNNKKAAKPLVLKDNILIAQAEPEPGAKALKIIGLDTARRGQQTVAGTMDLPAGVSAPIDESLNSACTVSAKVSEQGVVVSWLSSEKTMRGMPVDDEQGDEAARIRAAAAVSTKQGTFRIDLQSGTTTPVNLDPEPPTRGVRIMEMAAERSLAGVPTPQFLSADAKHVLVSKRIGNDSVWNKYSLTIYDRSNGNRIGEFKCHLSVVSFFVSDAQVVYETGPYVRRTEAGLANEPLKIRAVDLQTGKQRWSTPVRDTTFRGPFPP